MANGCTLAFTFLSAVHYQDITLKDLLYGCIANDLLLIYRTG